MRPNKNKEVKGLTMVNANAKYVKMWLKVMEEVGCS